MTEVWQNQIRRALLALAPIALALGFTGGILVLAGAPPLLTYEKLIMGSLGTAVKRADVLVIWVSLATCAAGLLVTFTAGQWNIGVEGQIVLGAIFATWAGRVLLEQPGAVAIPAMVGWGLVGGAFWGLLVGLLKIYGRVHEIFGGLGLNFVATALNIYLIFGPWKQRTGGTLSGTTIFPESLWLPTLPGLRLSILSIVIALVIVSAVSLSLRGTVWGLQLKAVGQNIRSAYILGLPTQRLMLSAFIVCGACAGLVGAYLVVGVHHRLVPSISSGYGFLSILIVLLSGFRALWTAPIALFFAAVNIGSTALQLDLQLDASLGGVLQSAIVLAVVLMQGVRERYLDARARPS
ncbi:MAG: ABC transporter permease [Anaerolineae bacterium]|nr:ABC transporter permease [Anaerolineae bacterium]MDW8100908.1 ABC transporter permease [Anaerolineae bacterium]